MYDQRKGFNGFAIVHLMGQQSLAGHVSVVQLGLPHEGGFGTNMLRVQFPGVEGCEAHEKFFGFPAIYSIEPCTEEEATRFHESGVRYGDAVAVPGGRRRDARERDPDELPF